MDSTQFCTVWTNAISGLNNDEYGLLEELLAPACVFEFVGRSRDEVIEALKRDRAAGWLRHDIISVSAVGSLLASTARNTFADGTAFYVAGVVRFDDDGKIVYIAASDERVSV